MSLNSIYILANLLALTGWVWLLLSVFTSRHSSIIVTAVPVLLALLYSVLMFRLLPFEGGGFSTLLDLASLFARQEIALIGWIHYLAFDLFIGAWQVRTARVEQISLFILLPALMLTMLLGPMGLLFFLVFRYLNKSHLAGTGEVRLSESG